MKSKLMVLTMVFGMILLGLTATNLPAAEPIVEQEIVTKEITEDVVVKTVDNFIVLYDASASMAQPYTFKDQKTTKGELTKKILSERNQTLPNLDWNSGLYLYTPWRESFPMQRYDKAGLAKVIQGLPKASPSQPSPLGEAFDSLNHILPRLAGETEVIIFTDGEYTRNKYFPVDPISEAKKIAGKYDVCFLLVSAATSEAGKKNLDEIAAVNQCSRVVPAEYFYERPDFVTGALWTVKSNVRVVSETVDKVVGMRTDDILFDSDKSDIRPEYFNELNTIGKFLQETPPAYLILSGYTDSTYKREYNYDLSRKRAESVADYFKTNFDIADIRLVTHWYGIDNPVAPNDTPEGRRLNRRVELRIAGVE